MGEFYSFLLHNPAKPLTESEETVARALDAFRRKRPLPERWLPAGAIPVLARFLAQPGFLAQQHADQYHRLTDEFIHALESFCQKANETEPCNLALYRCAESIRARRVSHAGEMEQRVAGFVQAARDLSAGLGGLDLRRTAEYSTPWWDAIREDSRTVWQALVREKVVLPDQYVDWKLEIAIDARAPLGTYMSPVEVPLGVGFWLKTLGQNPALLALRESILRLHDQEKPWAYRRVRRHIAPGDQSLLFSREPDADALQTTGLQQYYCDVAECIADLAKPQPAAFLEHPALRAAQVQLLENERFWYGYLAFARDPSKAQSEDRKWLAAHADRLLGALRPKIKSLGRPGVGHDPLCAVDTDCVDHPFYAAFLARSASLWKGLKPLLLAFRDLPVQGVGVDLRYWIDLRASDNPPDAACLFRQIADLLHAHSAEEQRSDPGLRKVRTEFGLFCLSRLKPAPHKLGAGPLGPPTEPDPRWRLGYVRALSELEVNPKGEGHHVLHRAMENDPDVEVRAAAMKAYEQVRQIRGSELREGVSPRRLVFAALWHLRYAHLLALGIKPDEERAQSTRDRELRYTTRAAKRRFAGRWQSEIGGEESLWEAYMGV